MKDKVSAGLMGLRGFYSIVNTKEKIALLVVIWALSGLTWFGYKLGNVETIERLILTCQKVQSSNAN